MDLNASQNLERGQYYIFHLNHEFEDSNAIPGNGREVSGGFFYAQHPSIAGSVIVCPNLMLLILRPGHDQSLEAGAVRINMSKIWVDPNVYLQDQRIRESDILRRIRATYVDGQRGRKTYVVNYTGRVPSNIINFNDFRQMQVSAELKHPWNLDSHQMNDLVIRFESKNLSSISVISLEFPGLFNDKFVNPGCMQHELSDVQVKWCFWNRSSATSNLTLWIRIHENMQSLKLNQSTHTLAVQTLNSAFKIPNVSLADENSYKNFKLGIWKWINNFDELDSMGLAGQHQLIGDY